MRRGSTWLLALLLVAAACSKRPHLGAAKHDAAPAVVVVDRLPAMALANMPLVDEREPNDDPAHAQPLEAGKGVRGMIGPQAGDVDVYLVRVPGEAAAAAGDAGVVRQAARIDLDGATGLTIELLDAAGRRLAAAGEGARLTIPNYSLAPGQDYFVRVAAGKATDARMPYQLAVAVAPLGPGEEIEPNDAKAQATVLAGSDATGYFGTTRDEDWLRLAGEAAAGATLKLEVGAVDDVAYAVRVLDEDGRQLAAARGGAGEAVVLRNAPWPEKGALVVLRAESGFNSAQRWTLHGTIEPPVAGMEVEPNDAPETAQRLEWTGTPPRAEVQGYLWRGDADVFSLHAEQAGVLSLDLEPPPHAAADLRLEILDGAGKHKPRLKADDAGAGKAEAIRYWYVDAGADVLVRVAARARDSLFEAPYHLTCSLAPAEDVEREPNGSRASATPLAAGHSVRGSIAPRGDEDWYRVEVPAGMSRVSVTLDDVPAGMTPSLRAVDEKGTIATAAGAALTATLRGGALWLVVRDGSGKATPQASYQLRASFE